MDFLNKTISLSYMQIFLMIIASILFVGFCKLYLSKMEREIEKGQSTKISYIMKDFFKAIIVSCIFFISLNLFENMQ